MENILSEVFGIWFLIGAAFVFFMQAGFAMVETGFTRAKNAGNIIMKNLMDFCIGTVVFMFLGFGILLGEDTLGGFIGTQPSTSSPITQILTGLTLYLTWYSVPPPLPLFPVPWQNVPTSYLTVFIPALFLPLFIRLKHTGSGAAAGWHRWASMILQAPAPSIW